jgi:hypothetical protein
VRHELVRKLVFISGVATLTALARRPGAQKAEAEEKK